MLVAPVAEPANEASVVVASVVDDGVVNRPAVAFDHSLIPCASILGQL